MQLHLDKRCLKIDKTNAKAMIKGVEKNGRIIRQSMWCAVTKVYFPTLLTLNKRPAKFQMSPLGIRLNPNTFSVPYKYVARCDSEYYIKNHIELWERLCSNGLFDVWNPIAPFNRFANSKTHPSQFRIQLLRIYEINEIFADKYIVHANDRIDWLIAENKMVTIKAPVIDDAEFLRIKQLLVESVADFI